MKNFSPNSPYKWCKKQKGNERIILKHPLCQVVRCTFWKITKNINNLRPRNFRAMHDKQRKHRCVMHEPWSIEQTTLLLLFIVTLPKWHSRKRYGGKYQQRVILVTRFSEKTLKERNGQWRKGIMDSLETRIRASYCCFLPTSWYRKVQHTHV